MTNTAIDALSICRIIKECGRSGVKRLSLDGLELEFGSDQLVELPKTKEPLVEEIISVPSTTQDETYLEDNTKVMLSSDDKEMLREFDELQLAIDDPVAYEQLQIDSDIERESTRGSLERNLDRGSKQNVHGGRGRGP